MTQHNNSYKSFQQIDQSISASFPFVFWFLIVFISCYTRIIDPHTISARQRGQFNIPPQITAQSSQTPPASQQLPKAKAKPKQAEIDFDGIEAERERRIDAIMRASPIERPIEGGGLGHYFDQITRKVSDTTTFHLGIDCLVELGNLLGETLGKAPHRGQREFLSSHDQLIIYLFWLSTQTTQKSLSTHFGVNPSLFSPTVDKIRLPLNTILTQRFASPPRPQIHGLST